MKESLRISVILGEQMSKRIRIVCLIFIALGLVTALTPNLIFPVCEYKGRHMTLLSGKKVPMKCFWTGRAEVCLGLLLALDGLLLALFHSREAGKLSTVMAVGIGAMIILMSTRFIGMCMSIKMPCNIGTKPALVLLGTVTIIAGGFGFLVIRTKE
jgi:hypothetical protein